MTIDEFLEMTVDEFFDNLKSGARWDVGVSINRSNSLPLDANSVFSSLADAENYAKGTPAEGTLANAYPGQILAVVTSEETIVYYIDANMNLQPVGNTKEVMGYIGEIPEESDAQTIIEYIDSKTKGIPTSDSLEQLQKDVEALDVIVNGKEASEGEEAVNGLVNDLITLNGEIARVEGKIPTVISALVNDSNYQTDTQVKATVEAAIAEVNHAVFEKVDVVPEASAAEPNVLYLVPSQDGKHHDIYAKINDTMVLIDDTDADLSGYALKSDLHEHTNKTLLDTITQDKVNVWDQGERNVIASVDENQFAIDADRKLTLLDIAQDKISGLTNAAGNAITLSEALASKVDAVEGSRLINAEEIAKLEGLVIDPETGETSLPISGQISMGQVDGLDTALAGKVDKVEGMGLSANNFTDTLLEKLNGIEENAQVNTIETIKFNGTEVTVIDKIASIEYNLPVATKDVLGGVKSISAVVEDGEVINASEIENTVAVNENGIMSVNSLNVNRLTQTEGEFVILNGGAANI